MSYSKSTNYGRKIIEGEQPKSKSVRRKTYQEKVLLMLIISLIIGVLLGLVGANIVYGLSATNNDKYGSFNSKMLTPEVTVDWSNGETFTPLNVNMDAELQEFIYCLSYAYDIDFAFVMGLIQKESSFRSDVISKTNDYGLMQINTINHNWLKNKFGFNDFLDPYQNVQAGLHILRNLFEKYEDPSKVLMAYNMGESGAKRLWNKGIYESNYSVSVLKNTAAFTAELEKGRCLK